MRFAKLAFFIPAMLFALQFTQNPSLTGPDAGQWQVAFALDESTDVEVAIVDLGDSSIVRHLAAGKLGMNPPAPLAANSLSQTLSWDGKDDLGNAATGTSFGVRVRAGMSAALDRFVGEDPYIFRRVKGISVDADGGVYVYGFYGTLSYCSYDHGSGNTTIRKFTADGTYEKTVFPFPAGMNTEDVARYGVSLEAGGAARPQFPWVAHPQIGTSLLLSPGVTDNIYSFLLAGAPDDEMTVLAGNHGLAALRIRTNSVFPDNGADLSLVTSPALPTPIWGQVNGPIYAALSPDRKYYLLSGYYQTVDCGNYCHSVVDTGFWREGRVFRVDAVTGIAAPFLTLDSVPVDYASRRAKIGPLYDSEYGRIRFSAVHGTAFDDSGRVFICDRWHGEIGVYDTLGNKLGAVPVQYPDQVAINKQTNEIYVSIRQPIDSYTGISGLLKFSGWRPGFTLIDSLRNPISGQLGRQKAFLAVSAVGNAPMIWYGADGDILVVRDNGASLDVVKHFQPKPWTSESITGFDRIAVDRRSEKVFVTNSWTGFFKIEDWSDPRFTACSTFVRGVKRKLWAGDMNISPDGQLYLREDKVCQGSNGAYTIGAWNGPITRYQLDHYHTPIPFANTDSNVLTPFYNGSKMGWAFGDRGIAVAPDKKVAAMEAYGTGLFMVTVFPDSGSADTGRMDTVVKPFSSRNYGLGCGGVRYDIRGNLYVGAAIRSPDHEIPSGFDNQSYDRHVGAVIRFPAGARGSVEGATMTAPGSDKIYLPGLGAFSGTGGECSCRSPRFDVDPYGRIFIPNALTGKVAVVDNNDNSIMRFGEYGNADSRGPGIPLAFPEGVAASENYIYITDIVNCRLVRVRMNYALENMHLPQAAADRVGGPPTRGAPTLSPTLAAAPNPFNPAVTVSLSLKSAKVRIYDSRGRMAADLSAKFAGGSAVWNASGLASGVYVVKAEAGNVLLTKKIILSK